MSATSENLARIRAANKAKQAAQQARKEPAAVAGKVKNGKGTSDPVGEVGRADAREDHARSARDDEEVPELVVLREVRPDEPEERSDAEGAQAGVCDGGVDTYLSFIASKRLTAPATGIAAPPELSPLLFPFQSDIARWALRRGRAAIWADCGLGKSWMALEWARVAVAHLQAPAIVLTPLAVAQQFVTEGAKLGIPVTLCREDADVRDGINVTNYERVHKFDCGRFGALVADESSCLKDYTSATRNMLVETFARTPFKLACTATPAPNDHIELGNHAEFLGVMSRVEMLSMFFVHDGGSTQDWRLKGHAHTEFYKWLCSWACMVRKPSDLGYEDGAFILPPLRIHESVIQHEMAPRDGQLFGDMARGLSEQRAARRGSMGARVAACVDIVKADTTGDQWICWADLNDEQDALEEAFGAECVSIYGSLDGDEKVKRWERWQRNEARILVSKPSIFGHGVNAQQAHKMAYVGVSNSFEAWYQSLRREYRFGQQHPVDCYVITSSAEGAVVANLKRKQTDAARMADEMVTHMAAISSVEIRGTGRTFTAYDPRKKMTIPKWLNGGAY